MKQLKKDILLYAAALLAAVTIGLSEELPRPYSILINLIWVIPAAFWIKNGLLVLCRDMQSFRRDMAKPHNYVAITVDEKGIEYTPLSKVPDFIDWSEITKIRYVRAQATFPDLDGYYNETYWLISTPNRYAIEIMDESGNRALLLKAFQRYITGFSLLRARIAMISFRQGTWVCFGKAHLTTRSRPTR